MSSYTAIIKWDRNWWIMLGRKGPGRQCSRMVPWRVTGQSWHDISWSAQFQPQRSRGSCWEWFWKRKFTDMKRRELLWYLNSHGCVLLLGWWSFLVAKSSQDKRSVIPRHSGEIFTFYRLPKEHHKHLKSTDILKDSTRSWSVARISSASFLTGKVVYA